MPAARGKVVAAFDLRSTLAAREDDHRRRRAGAAEPFTRGLSSSLDGERKGGGTVARFAKAARAVNRGVADRAARDLLNQRERRAGDPSDDHVSDVLTQKSKIYDDLVAGKTAGLTPGQRSALLLDFDRKVAELSSDEEDDDDSDDAERLDRDESALVPREPGAGTAVERVDPNDPVMEYQDEYGRTRTAKRSQLPAYVQDIADDHGPEEHNIVHGETFDYPVYEPTEEDIRRRHANLQSDAPLAGKLNAHYDASTEKRDRNAGFRGFSQDETIRAAQQEELRQTRRETEAARAAAAADKATEGSAAVKAVEAAKQTEGEARLEAAKRRKEEARKRALDRAAAAEGPPTKVARTA